MSEIRQDPTIKEWVIIATERSQRPSDLIRIRSKSQKPPFVSTCPFCPGNEDMITPIILSYPNQKTGSWQTRVVSNKYPAVDRILR